MGSSPERRMLASPSEALLLPVAWVYLPKSKHKHIRSRTHWSGHRHLHSAGSFQFVCGMRICDLACRVNEQKEGV